MQFTRSAFLSSQEANAFLTTTLGPDARQFTRAPMLQVSSLDQYESGTKIADNSSLAPMKENGVWKILQF